MAGGAPDRAKAYLLIRAGATLALPIERVAEILPLAELANPPSASAVVAGTVNVAGVAVTILRLASLLGLDEPPMTIHCHLVRLNGVEPPVALLSERSETILDAADVSLSPLADGTTFNGCVRAELISGDAVVAHLLDVDRLLTEEEQQRVADYADRAQRRLSDLEAVA